MRLDPTLVQHQIANLVAAYPDLSDDAEGWSDSLSSETELDELLTKLVCLIEDSQSLIDGTAIRQEELAARVARFKRRVEAYRSLIFKLMEAADLHKRELPLATLSIRKGSPKVVIVNEAEIPDSLCKFVRKPDMALIKQALIDSSDGSLHAGAMLSNAEPSLTVRVR